MYFTYGHGDRPVAGYTIMRAVGRGGFGEVYSTVGQGGREVALKRLGVNFLASMAEDFGVAPPPPAAQMIASSARKPKRLPRQRSSRWWRWLALLPVLFLSASNILVAGVILGSIVAVCELARWMENLPAGGEDENESFGVKLA
jgi:hypothetical protein